MPKVKRPLSVVLQSYVREFEDLSIDGKELFCDACEVSVASKKRFLVQQHLQTARHASNKLFKQKYNERSERFQRKLGPKRFDFGADQWKTLLKVIKLKLVYWKWIPYNL